MIELSIVIPCYNEAKRLPKTLRAIDNYLRERKTISEIVIVDDGSVDRTLDKIKSKRRKNLKIIKLSENHGKGYAVRVGMMAAKGRSVLMMDADSSITISELDKLWPFKDRHEVVIGSRFLNTSRFGTLRPLRLLVSKVGNLIFRLLFGLKIRDTQCGFKLFSHRSAKAIFSRTIMNGFAFDMEVLTLAHRLGFSIKEVPIVWRDRPSSAIRAVRSSWQALAEVIKFHRAARLGSPTVDRARHQ